MAALHYMLDYVLRTSPSDLLPERSDTDVKLTDTVDHQMSMEHYQPLKKHFKDHISRTPYHGPQSNFTSIGTTNDQSSTASLLSFQRIIDYQKDRIQSLERSLKIQKDENKDLRELVSHLKETIGTISYESPARKRLASIAFDEDEAYDNVISSMNRKNRKNRAKSPDLSEDDADDEDYHDSFPKRRRLFKSKEDRDELSVFDEEDTFMEHKSPSTKHIRTSTPTLSLESKFTLPSDVHLDKKYFLKWSGEIYAVAKAFGDRNRLRKLVAKYESETDKKASYLLDGEELRKLKAINPICHNTSYLGLYNLEFVRYFQNVVSA